jgi:O-antigen ligase
VSELPRQMKPVVAVSPPGASDDLSVAESLRRVAPALYVLLTLYYSSVYHLTNTFQLASVLVILAWGAAVGSAALPLLFSSSVLVVSRIFSVGDPFFAVAWFLLGLVISSLGARLRDGESMLRNGRLLVRAAAVFGVIGLIDQYILRSTLFSYWVGRPRVSVAFVTGLERYAGFFQQPNVAGMYLVVVYSVGLGIVLAARGSRLDVFATILLALLVVATLSRASVLALITVSVIGYMVQRGLRPSFILVLTMVGISVMRIPALNAYAASYVSPDYQSNLARNLIYSGSLEALAHSPVLGYGFGSIASVLPSYVPVGYFGIPNPLTDAHNLFFGVAIWGGVAFAIILAVVFILGAGRVCVSGDHRPWSLGCLAIVVNCQFDSPLNSLPHLSLYGIVVSAALLTRRDIAVGQRFMSWGGENRGGRDLNLYPPRGRDT